MMKSVAVLFVLTGVMNFAMAKSERSKINVEKCIINIAGGAYATFAGKFGGEISHNELIKNSKVGVAGCAEGSLIFKFNLTINSKDKSKEFSGTSHKLTDDMLKSLRLLKKGDSFEFKKIRAQLPTGGKIDVVGRIFTIV